MRAISNRVSGGLPLRAAIIHALPAILYGVRIAASASIALYIAFFLQMDQPSWAGTTAVIVAQPTIYRLSSTMRSQSSRAHLPARPCIR